MAWQDAVKGLLTNISIGQNPEAYQNAQKIQMAKAQQEFANKLATSAEGRAAAGEGRDAARFGNEQSGWGDAAIMRALGIEGKRTENRKGAADAGMAETNLSNEPTKFASEMESAATNRNVAKGNLGVAQGNLGQRKAEFAAGEGQRGSEARTAAANADVAEGTAQTRIAAINDPAAKWEAELPGATSILNNAIAKGTQADIDDAKAQLEAIRGEVRKARAMAAIKKQLAGKARGQ